MTGFPGSLDKSLFLLINSLHSTWLDSLMSFLSGQVVWLPFIGYFFWKCWKQKGRNPTFLFALFLLLTLIASDVTSSYILKNLFQRLRPCREIDLKPLIYSFGQKCGGRFGFVSSHAANSVALVLYSVRSLKLKKEIWLWAMPLLVGWSRIYLGVHYPGDILGGAIVGMIYGFIFSCFYKNLQGATR